MAIKTPAEKAELARKIGELKNRKGDIQENLLATMQKQAVLYDNEVKKLTKITSIKELQRKIQKELIERQINTNFLEDNIVKRNQKIIEQNTKINHLKTIITSNTVKSMKYSDTELKDMLKFKDIYGKFLLAKKIGGGLTTEEEKLITRIGAIRDKAHPKTLAQMMAEKGISAKKTREMMLQSVIQTANNKVISQTNKMLREQHRLMIEERKEARALSQDWLQSLGFVSEYTNLLGTALTHLKAMGVNTNKLAFLLKEEVIFAGAGVLSIFKQIYGMFIELDKVAFGARKEMGMLRSEHAVLRKQAEDLYKEYAHLGLESEMVYKTQKSIALELGSSLSSTKNIVEQAALMSAQFGISEDTTVKMLKTLGQMGSTTASAQTQMVGFAGALSNAAGIPLPQVMDDVAKASGEARMMLSKTPLDMIKAAVEARRLGTTLNQMASSSRKILNFTESMEAEMEASVLLGRPINLQLARQLAYSGKIVESNKEILRIAKQVNFDKMDPFSAEAFARAAGKTVDEMKSMIQADREQNMLKSKAAELASKGDFSLRNQLKSVEDMKKANEASAKARGEDYKLIVKSEANQERLTSITNSWKKVIADLGMVFLPLIDNALKFAAAVIPIGVGVIKVMGGFSALNRLLVGGLTLISKWMSGIKGLGWLGKILGWVNSGVKGILGLVAGVGKLLQPIATTVGGLFAKVFGFAKPLLNVFSKMKIFGTAFGTFGKAIPIIGEVIMALQGIWSAGVRIWDIFKKLFSGDFIGAFKGSLALIPGIIWDVLGKPIFELVGWIAGLFSDGAKEWVMSIATGIESIGDKIFDGILWPFKSAWSWLDKTFFGHSESPLSELILKGIVAIGGMVFDNLVSPYKQAWDFVKNIFSGNLGSVLLGGVKAVGNAMYDSIITPFKKSWDFISSLFGGGSNSIQPAIGKPMVSDKASTMDIPVDRSISDNEVRSYRELGDVSSSVRNKETTTQANTTNPSELMVALLAEFKGLREDLASGKIAVNMDGQLVQTNMNRGNKFRGNFGAIMG